jgi:uncharacterized cupredoxin-like copper-binding protein
MSNDLEQEPTVRAVAPRHRPRRRTVQAFAAVGVAAVVAAGCGATTAKTAAPKAARSAASTGTAPTKGTAPGNGTVPSNATAPSNRTAPSKVRRASTITAKLSEFHIALSTMKLEAGAYSFDVINAGHTVHALEINGPGVDDRATHDLNPGQSADLKVTLEPGRYDVFCPVGNHKSLGMNLELTVAARGAKTSADPAATPAQATPPTTASSGGGSGY